MIAQTILKKCSASLKNGVLKVSISFTCDQEELAQIEKLVEWSNPVSIEIKEVNND